MQKKVQALLSQRSSLLSAFSSAPFPALGLGSVIGSPDANFIVVPILSKETREKDNVRAQSVYKALAEEEAVVVRFRGNEPGCLACLRVTVGSKEENKVLLSKFEQVLSRI
jgi:histidinol-phosphate aminotransferase